MICLGPTYTQSHLGKSQSQMSQRTGSPHGQRTPSPIGTIGQGPDNSVAQRTCSPVDRQSLSGSPMRRSSSGSLSPRSPTCTSPMTVEDDGMFFNYFFYWSQSSRAMHLLISDVIKPKPK